MNDNQVIKYGPTKMFYYYPDVFTNKRLDSLAQTILTHGGYGQTFKFTRTHRDNVRILITKDFFRIYFMNPTCIPTNKNTVTSYFESDNNTDLVHTMRNCCKYLVDPLTFEICCVVHTSDKLKVRMRVVDPRSYHCAS